MTTASSSSVALDQIAGSQGFSPSYSTSASYGAFASMFQNQDSSSMVKIIGVLSASAITLTGAVAGIAGEPGSGSLPNVDLGIERLASYFELATSRDSVDYLFENALPESVPREWIAELERFRSVESDFELPWA